MTLENEVPHRYRDWHTATLENEAPHWARRFLEGALLSLFETRISAAFGNFYLRVRNSLVGKAVFERESFVSIF